MRNKKSTCLLVATLLISTVVATINFAGGAQNDPSSKRQDDPTLLQEGVLTEKQKHHSKLFKKYDSATRGRKLRELVAERGDVEVFRDLGDVLIPSSFNMLKSADVWCKQMTAFLGDC